MTESKNIRTIQEIKEIDLEAIENNYNYQEELTKELDSFKGIFDQEIINKIVLWKVNRYASIEENTLELLNQIPPIGLVDEKIAKDVLLKLLSTKGIRLAMASSILRFRNPTMFQIIDQRVYRFITGEELKTSTKIEYQINYYFEYLKKLKSICKERKIEFYKADRFFYEMDKVHNKDVKIKY